MSEAIRLWTLAETHAPPIVSGIRPRSKRYSNWAASEFLPILVKGGLKVKQNGVLFTLLVDDYEAALDFYVEKLELFVVVADTQTSETSRYVCIALKDFVDKFMIHVKAPSTPRSASLVGGQGGDEVLITLPVEDIKSKQADLLSRGVTIEQEIEWLPYGGGACVTDPFGNRLSLFQHFVSRFA